MGGDTMGMTLGELTKAIQQHIDLDMDAEVAQGMAEHALGFFGFYNRIIDNALEPTDRNLFYMFQDYDLLTTESEETTLWDGREWRIHYWKFKPDLRERVEAYMQRNLQEDEIDPFGDIYSTDGPSIWTREGEKVANPNAFTSDWRTQPMQVFLIRRPKDVSCEWPSVWLFACSWLRFPPRQRNTTRPRRPCGRAIPSTATFT